MPEQKQEEDKIGTSVTFLDPDNTGPVTMRGVPFLKDEQVDLDEFMPEAQAKEMAKKLAGNAHFKVEGGPDHQAQREKQQKAQEEVEKKKQEAAERQAQQLQRGAQSEQPPPDWKGPEKPHLESDRSSAAKRK